MVIVPIDLRTLRVNPRKGETRTPFCSRPATVKVSAKFLDGREAPEHVGGFILMRRERTSSEEEVVADYSRCIPEDFDPEKTKEAFKTVGGVVFAMEVDYGISWIEHAPEPTWLYGYLERDVPCGQCGNACATSAIETHYNEFGDYEESEMCPACGALDSFEYRFETVEEALARREGR